MTAIAIEILLLPFLSYPLLLGVAVCTPFVSFPLFLILLVLAIESDMRVSLCVQGKRNKDIAYYCRDYTYERMPSTVRLVQATEMEKVEHDGVNGEHVRSRVAGGERGS